MMDCEKETTSENADHQQLLEKNKDLEEVIKKMKSDYLILKEKIICIDTLIQTLKEKHNYCELLEKKYTELKNIIDESKRLCGTNTFEYQDLLLTFGPLKTEKEKLEVKCSQQSEEINKLNNDIRCHEMVQNQMTEASKKQQSDFENLRKDNVLLQVRIRKLEQMFKSSEKKMQADKEKSEKKEALVRRSSKRLAGNKGEGEGGLSSGEMARGIEDVKEESKNDKSIAGAKKRVIRNTSKAKKQQPKSEQSINLRRGRPKKDLSGQDAKEEGGSDCKRSDRSVGKGCAKAVDDCCKRLAILYQDLLMSSDDEVQKNDDDRIKPDGGDDDDDKIQPTEEKKEDVENEDLVDNVKVGVMEGGDWISCIAESHRIINSEENEMSAAEGNVRYETGRMNRAIDYQSDDTIVEPFAPQQLGANQPFYYHSEDNIVGPIDRSRSNDDRDFDRMPDDKVTSDAADDNAQNFTISTKDNSNVDRMDTTPPESCDASSKRSKTKRKSLAEIVNIPETVEASNNLPIKKKKRRGRSDGDDLALVPATRALKNFYQLNVEDALSMLSVAKPPSPLASHPDAIDREVAEQPTSNVPPESIALATPQSENVVAEPRSLVPYNQADNYRNNYGNNYYWNEAHFDYHEIGQSYANFESESPSMAMSSYFKLVKLVRFPSHPMSPFLFEARKSKIGGMSFVRLIMKVVRKFGFDVTRYLFRRDGANSNPHLEPTLPPTIVRLVEIIVACGSTLDQGEETLELFVKVSFSLIINHVWKGSCSKLNEFYISNLSCCVVAILRQQGNMERARMLLYQVLKNSSSNSRVCTVVMTICAVWPQCLMANQRSLFSALEKVFQYYVTVSLDQQDSTKDFVKKLCGWDNVEQDADELASALFDQVRSLFGEGGISKDDVSKISWEMQTAFTFLCTKEGWEWTSSTVVSGFLWPFLGAWANHQDTFDDYFVQLVIDLLGNSLQMYLDKIDDCNYNNIFINLQSLVMQESVDLKIRESAVKSVLKLSNGSVPYSVVPFLTEHSNSFDEDTLALLGQFNLSN